jgi:putative transposase
MPDVCADFGCELAEFNGHAEHVHLVNFPPTITISPLVNSLKGVSSRRLRQESPELLRHYWRAKRLWSGSYFAGTVAGAPITGPKIRPRLGARQRPEARQRLRSSGARVSWPR